MLLAIAGVLFRSRNRHVEFQKLRGIEANANLEGCFFYFSNPFLYEHVSMSFSRIFLDKRSNATYDGKCFKQTLMIQKHNLEGFVTLALQRQ